MRGKFITFEGAEGTGKTLHTKMLCAYLRKKGLEVVHTLEPGSTRVGKKIRNILLDPKNKGMTDLAELFLYLADRNQHVTELIIPNLKKGKIVICDRYYDATVVYQGYGRGISLPIIKKLNQLATKGLKPDLTIVLDVPVKLGLRRAFRTGPYRGDRIEREKIVFHQRVRKGYQKIAKQEPKRVKVVKTTLTIAQVQQKIKQLVDRVL